MSDATDIIPSVETTSNDTTDNSSPSVDVPIATTSTLHTPTASTLNGTYKSKSQGDQDRVPIKSISEESNLLKTTTAVVSASWIPKEENKKIVDVKPIAEGSHLLKPTTSTVSGAYKLKPDEEEVIINPPPVNIKPISEGSNLLKLTTANVTASWSPPKNDDKKVADVKPISADSHLLKSTTAAVSSAWSEERLSNDVGPLEPISSESHLLKPTASLKSAQWTPKEEEETVSASIAPISPDSGLLKQTSSLVSSTWVPKDAESSVIMPPPTAPISSNSPLLRATKASTSGMHKKEEAPLNKEGSARNISPVPQSLLMTTANVRNQQWKPSDAQDSASGPRWNNNAPVPVGTAELPVVRNDLESVQSKLLEPTANTKNAAYKPKDKGEDPANIHSAQFNANKSASTLIPPPPPVEKFDSPYRDVKSKLMEPTAAALASAKKAEEESQKMSPNSVKPISEGSNLLKGTSASASAGWSPKEEARKTAPVSPLRADSNLLKSTKAVEDATWTKEKQREAEAAPRSAMLLGLGTPGHPPPSQAKNAETTDQVISEE